MPMTVHLALGSNLGDRRAQLDRALTLLRAAGVAIQKMSAYHETEPSAGRRGRGGI